MAGDIQKEVHSNQIAELVHGFLQIEIKFRTMLPKELVQLQDRLTETHPTKEEPHGAPNDTLFYRVSYSLYRKDTPTMGELSEALSVPLSTATRMVDWLVKNGYARRLPDPEDRRIVRVTLTSNGREIYKAIESYIEQRFQQILSCLTVEEQGTLYTLLRRVMSALK